MPPTRLAASLLAVLMSLTAITIAQDSPPRIEPKDARKFRGQVVTLCGVVVSTGCRDNDHVTLLQLSPYPADDYIPVTVPSHVRHVIGERMDDQVLGQNVCATGVINKINGRHRITVDDASRLTIV